MRRKIPYRSPEDRVKDFDEIIKLLTPQWVVAEAQRCLLCEDPPCEKGCPCGVKIERFIRQIRNRNFSGAIKTIRAENIFAGICGRVCPQEVLCEKMCSSSGIDEPIAIGLLQRFVADLEREPSIEPMPPVTKKKVAVVGAGPSGLACAFELRKLGFDVYVFEKEDYPGGLLSWAIPTFRLPLPVLEKELSIFGRVGISIRTGKMVDDLNSLLDEFVAVYVAVGAYEEERLDIKGEELNGVFTARNFLYRVKQAFIRKAELPKIESPVVVIGGGNSAVDAAETALRLVGRDVFVFYRRREEDMPAWRREVSIAKEDGVKFEFLASPVEFIGENGKLVGIRFVRMVPCGVDQSGRAIVKPKESDFFVVQARTALVAIGTKKTPKISIFSQINEIDPETGKTNLDRVFAGGDFVLGGKTVVEAIAFGKRAAKAIASSVE